MWHRNREREEFIDFIKSDKSNYGFIEYLDLFIFSKFNNLICSTMKVPMSNENIYIIKNIINGNYQHFFDKYIRKHEGWTFSTDKVRFIINRLIKSLIKKENLSLYETYEEIEGIDKTKWHKQAYWSPTTIKDTDEAFKLFNDWYYFK